MTRRVLGSSEINISAIGLGCMGMSEFYGPTDDAQSLATLERALDLGIDFFDTADMYGPYRNEELLARFIRGKRDRVVIATKFGIVRSSDPAVRGVDNRPEHIRASCEGSLKRLGIETIDLYYVHRVDRAVPIEETIGTLAELVTQGKIRAIGLSEVSADTLRRAASVHPIAALQSEYSLWTRDPEAEMHATCREMNTAFVAYSPLGRGMLTGAPPEPSTLAEDDFRRRIPRFEPDAYRANLRLINGVIRIADAHGATAAQVALAWVLAQGDNIIPIPGTRRLNRLEENAAAVRVELTPHELQTLKLIFKPEAIHGERSSSQGLALLNA